MVPNTAFSVSKSAVTSWWARFTQLSQFALKRPQDDRIGLLLTHLEAVVANWLNS